jgi:hypothetical protein
MSIETQVPTAPLDNCPHCQRVSGGGFRTKAGTFCSKDCSLLNLATAPHRSLLFWLGQIALPVPILLGAFLPIDIGSGLILAPAFLGGLVWSSSLLGGIFRTIRRRPVYRYRYLRGALSVTFFAAAALGSSLSTKAAVSFAESAALDIEALCFEHGSCPEVPPGWLNRGGGVAETSAGMTIHYRLIYRRLEDGRAFRIDLRQSIDRGRTWQGGVAPEPEASGRSLPSVE